MIVNLLDHAPEYEIHRGVLKGKGRDLIPGRAPRRVMQVGFHAFLIEELLLIAH